MCGDVEMCGEKKRKGGTHSGWGQRKWRGTWWLRAKEEEGCSGWGQRRGRTVDFLFQQKHVMNETRASFLSDSPYA